MLLRQHKRHALCGGAVMTGLWHRAGLAAGRAAGLVVILALSAAVARAMCHR